MLVQAETNAYDCYLSLRRKGRARRKSWEGSGKGGKFKTPGIQRPKRRKRRNQVNKPPLCHTQALGEGTGERHSHSQNACPLVHLTCAPTHATHAPHRNKPVFGFQEDGTAVDSDAEEKIHELQGAGGGVTHSHSRSARIRTASL